MEPIEINAGVWYLRALRADDRIDDRPALAAGEITDPDYVTLRSAGWAEETHFSWAVCEPTTAELVAEVGVTPTGDGAATVSGWAHPGYELALDAGLRSVRRFLTDGLGLTERIEAADLP
ncbi:hypothetical protein ACL02S_13850 [Nocardia sp. 004]|uniref:hypothetical protein n=1 Tax=Nocardia sp. 004 TaxID=3385978 RepID=UPI0039A1C2F5